MQHWMQKNVNKHDVSIQVNEDEETSLCQSYQSNYLKSTNHLNAIISAIELSKNNSQINPKNENNHKTNYNNNININSKTKGNNANIQLNDQTKSNVSTRKETNNNLNTEVVKRGPGRPKSVINGDKLKHSEIKKESDKPENGIIKEEINNNNKFPANNEIKKNFIETDNELIND